ncbi:hypothetical protein [Capnocytophaga sp. oral taxon 902]|nr:hypothetical protein [Capnocytophaga sp. oral taxon 902]
MAKLIAHRATTACAARTFAKVDYFWHYRYFWHYWRFLYYCLSY